MRLATAAVLTLLLGLDCGGSPEAEPESARR